MELKLKFARSATKLRVNELSYYLSFCSQNRGRVYRISCPGWRCIMQLSPFGIWERRAPGLQAPLLRSSEHSRGNELGLKINLQSFPKQPSKNACISLIFPPRCWHWTGRYQRCTSSCLFRLQRTHNFSVVLCRNCQKLIIASDDIAKKCLIGQESDSTRVPSQVHKKSGKNRSQGKQNFFSKFTRGLL